ncbi:hypothetical protein [Allorhizobium taibaishanense]|uniref:Peptidoglycan/LPS O-acetylase OafA/YrhL n=1 Tax=Allorhizobium taibaishanense TaxID=887144 RepID=A0A1Q9A0E9_9HYPH|nr:hypothetical protein [Allorhizobium taibaishanense]MBB4010437.1 peptidoglycan/LPS O-acetylase OafA/YrhL [Allorhizobium taibaishanense]OLP48009.1 hypothetical protein BJF91_11415 [Allorhizobium taibaishanense]
MTPIILLAVALCTALCVLAFVLATHALPFMAGFAAFQLVQACGAGAIVAGLAAIAIAILSLALFAYLRQVLRNPYARLFLALVYAAPAAIALYALMHGVTGAVPFAEPVRQAFCLASCALVAITALLRLADPK